MDIFEHTIAPRHIPQGITVPRTDQEQRILSTAIAVASSLSILGAGCIILSFARFQGLRLFRHRLILCLAISDFVRAVVILIPASMDLSNAPLTSVSNYDACICDGFIVQTFVTQSDYWILMIAIYTFIVVTGRNQTAAWLHSHQSIVFAIPWVLSLASASVSFGITTYEDIGSWCWIKDERIRLLYNFLPRWIIILAMLVMYARISFVLLRAHKDFGTAASKKRSSGRPQSAAQEQDVIDTFGPLTLAEEGARYSVLQNSNRLRRLARHMALYPIVYIILWILPTAVCLYHVATKVAAPFPVQTVDKSFIVIQGFVNAITYGVSEASVACWRTLFFAQAESKPSKHEHSNFPRSPGRMAQGSGACDGPTSPPNVSSTLAPDTASTYAGSKNDTDIRGDSILGKDPLPVKLEDLENPSEHLTQDTSTLWTAEPPCSLKVDPSDKIDG